MVNDTDCIPPSISDFPADGLTREEREQGWILIHFLISCYIFIALSIICDQYFVPAVEKLSEVFSIPEDIAGATIMAVASSSPEFFTNIIGTFVTEGDIGIGAIVGSAVCNLMGVSAICGIFSGVTIRLDWWPLTRDCFFYIIAVTLLIVILEDSLIHWYEAGYLCVLYIFYLLLMTRNKQLRQCARESKLCEKIPCFKTDTDLDEKNVEFFNESDDALSHLITFPFEGSCFQKICWSIEWPIYVVFYLTIPDCRSSRLVICYGISFFMCCVWMAILTYLVSWTLTIIGDTFYIPDSVMGITFLAIGTSVPEVVSSINVARRGHGAMAICNSVGSNTFDILICLGFPWLIKASFFSTTEGDHCLIINSGGIRYATVILLASVAMIYFAFCISSFTLGKHVGFICGVMYMSFLVFATLLELNMFFVVNKPTCPE